MCGVNGVGELLAHEYNNTPGAYVPVNNDDDAYDHYDGQNDTNGQLNCDLNTTGATTGEDDLLPFFVNAIPQSGGGQFTLRINEPGLGLYKGANKSGGLSNTNGGTSYTLDGTAGTPSAPLYIEGRAMASTSSIWTGRTG